MRRFQTYGPSLVVLAAAALVLFAGPAAVRKMQAARTGAVVRLAQQRLDGDDLLERLNEATRAVASAVEPAVVYIEGHSAAPQGLARRSTGSGWVYDEAGHIVTNAHLVAGMERVNVQFYDGRLRQGRVVGADRWTDVAVLKVDADPDALFPARRATDQPVRQGDRVFAFGSPFGFKFSMSEGIVSGLGRHAAAGSDNAYTNFIQTDAAINPGNSGGPLVDVDGRVIGMNTAIVAEADTMDDATRNYTGVSGGIGFAIPLDTIESVAEQLIGRGEIVKGFLGVSLRDLETLPTHERREMGWMNTSGVLVAGTLEDQPAHEAGVRAGDVILRVDGRETPSAAVLRTVIGNKDPGETVSIEVLREGERKTFDVTLAAARLNRAGTPVPVEGQADEDSPFEQPD